MGGIVVNVIYQLNKQYTFRVRATEALTIGFKIRYWQNAVYTSGISTNFVENKYEATGTTT